MQNKTQQINTNSIKPIFQNLGILNIKEIYCITVVREFMDDGSLAKKINHNQNTRRKIEGKYMVPKFKNDYGKYSLSVTLPTIINEIPTNITKERNYNIRTKLIKEYYLNN